MTIEKKLLGTNPVASGGDSPEAVSFDGSGDHLKRTSDLTNNANGRAFTFSAWVYRAKNSQANILDNNTAGVLVQFDSGGQIGWRFMNAGTSAGINHTSNYTVPLNTWTHILISGNINVSYSVRIYFNDVQDTGSVSYSATDISFSTNIHYIGAEDGTGSFLNGRLAHVYLDYDYLNLSTTSNRRLFITADGKPADSDTLAARNPIMYLPMKDAATAGSNSGTGGDFTAIGVLATAERGPNQDNCSASLFDGSNDYLYRSLMSGASDSKSFTYAGVIRTDAAANNSFLEMYNTSTSAISYMIVSSVLRVVMQDATGAVLTFSYSPSRGYMSRNKSFALAFSVDLTDANKRHVVINGVDVTSLINWSVYINRTIPFSTYPVRIGGDPLAFGYLTGSVGETYFNTVYTNLATSNPFWDSDTNRPNSVRKVIADTSVTPLLALPLICNDAGKNFGSGGDLTVTSGPFTGARGGSEFWSKGAYFNGSSWLSKSMSLPDTKTVSLVMAVNFNALSAQVEMFNIKTNTSNTAIRFQRSAGGQISFVTYYQPNSFPGVEMTDTTSMSAGNTYLFFISADSATTNNNHLYINGADNSTVNYNNAASTLDLSNNGQVSIASGEASQASSAINAHVQFVYFTTNYIDFSQESNRNKFVDQLGYPRDLTQQIEDGDIANPQVYMKFDPSISLGTNSGTGGNFTVNGTETAGKDFTP